MKQHSLNRSGGKLRHRLTGGILVVTMTAALGCAGGPPPVVSTVDEAPPGDVVASLFLIGDGGEPDPAGDPVLLALTREVAASPGEALVVFLGDNIYPSGLPDSTHEDRLEMERRIADQVNAVLRTDAPAVFIPGNHDWTNGREDGWEAVQRQERFIEAMGEGRIEQLPDNGCPGPAVIDFGPNLRLIALDTQWWLHGHRKATDASSGCATYTEEAVIDSLRAAIAAAGDRHVVIVAHHPLVSGGTHGGRFTWKDHIFPLTAAQSWAWLPLPIIGSAYPLSRQWGISDQDMAGGKNEHMRAAFAEAFAAEPPLIFAGGHEHNLEVIVGGPVRYNLVSGAGYYGHDSHTTYRDETLYAVATSGFMRLDVLRNGRLRLGVLTVDENASTTEAYSMFLDVPPKPSVTSNLN